MNRCLRICLTFTTISLAAAAQARPQEPPDWRPHLNTVLGASFYRGSHPQPDTLYETLSGLSLHVGMGLALESPEHQLSGHLDATFDRYIPLYLCIDGCPSSGIPTAIAGARLGARWRWPDLFPHTYVTAGVGVYAPVGRSPHWHTAAPGLDAGLGFLYPHNRGLVLEYRLVWLPGDPRRQSSSPCRSEAARAAQAFSAT